MRRALQFAGEAAPAAGIDWPLVVGLVFAALVAAAVVGGVVAFLRRPRRTAGYADAVGDAPREGRDGVDAATADRDGLDAKAGGPKWPAQPSSVGSRI